MAAPQTVPLTEVPSARRSSAAAAASALPVRLAASMISTVAQGESHS
jgi:hypothetical protein